MAAFIAGVSGFIIEAIMTQPTLFPMPPRDGVLIFRPWITCPKTGKRIYPKRGRVFPLWVKQ